MFHVDSFDFLDISPCTGRVGFIMDTGRSRAKFWNTISIMMFAHCIGVVLSANVCISLKSCWKQYQIFGTNFETTICTSFLRRIFVFIHIPFVYFYVIVAIYVLVIAHMHVHHGAFIYFMMFTCLQLQVWQHVAQIQPHPIHTSQFLGWKIICFILKSFLETSTHQQNIHTNICVLSKSTISPKF